MRRRGEALATGRAWTSLVWRFAALMAWTAVMGRMECVAPRDVGCGRGMNGRIFFNGQRMVERSRNSRQMRSRGPALSDVTN